MLAILNEKEMIILEILLKKKFGYITYPGELEKLSNKKITRPGAKLLCSRLEKKGILQLVSKRSPKRRKSTHHYSLKKDNETYNKIIRYYFRALAKDKPFSWQIPAVRFMNSQNIMVLINSTLVRDVLASKNVEIFRFVKLKKSKRKINGVYNFEHLRNHCPILFPIRPSSATMESMLSKSTIYQEELTEEQKEKSTEKIIDYYENIEEKEVILPILALIQISPTALRYFLSDWKPYIRDKDSKEFNSQGFNTIEHILFRLVWNTINDLSLIRRIPWNSFVLNAYVSGGKSLNKSFPLLQLQCKDLLIDYEAGFDTDHDYYGDEGGNIIEVETNPENCSVKINLKGYPKIKLRYK